MIGRGEGDVFCKKCGTKVETVERLSPEESIALAKNLEKKYGEWDAVKDEISDLERDYKRYLLPEKRPRYSAFRFFWPFLIYSQLAELGVCLIAILILLGGGFRSESSFDSLESGMYFFAFIAAAVTLIIGGVYATKKRDRMNSALIETEYSIMNKQKNIEARIIELKSRQKLLEQDLKQYNGWLPATLRNTHGVKKARAYIESGEARDLYEAAMLCQNRKI